MRSNAFLEHIFRGDSLKFHVHRSIFKEHHSCEENADSCERLSCDAMLERYEDPYQQSFFLLLPR